MLTLLFVLCQIPPAAPFGQGEVRVVINTKKLDIAEVSGMVASRRHKGVLWVHNDSGDGPRIFALEETGTLLATVTLGGADAIDWEEIAMGPGPKPGLTYLYVGDFGNNRAHTGGPRDFVSIYRFEEPDVLTNGEVSAERIDLVYPDRAHDVEAMLVDPRDGAIYVFSKRDPKARVYRLPPITTAQEKHTLAFIGELPYTMLTAADISADGGRILLKDYGAVWYFTRNDHEDLFQSLSRKPRRVADYRVEPQGEAIAFDSSGQGFYTFSEARGGKRVPLYYYPFVPTK